jgi:hypothetical protein
VDPLLAIAIVLALIGLSAFGAVLLRFVRRNSHHKGRADGIHTQTHDYRRRARGRAGNGWTDDAGPNEAYFDKSWQLDDIELVK